jgi:DNA gyrase subunit A
VSSLALVPGDHLLTTLLVQPTDQLLFIWRPEGASKGEQTLVLYAQEIPLLGRTGAAQRLVEGRLLAAVLLPRTLDN